jgi:hypothetical protein
MGLDLAGGEATRIQRQDFLIEALQAPLALFHELRLETAVTITGYINVELCRLGLDRFLALAVAAVARATPVPGMGCIP